MVFFAALFTQILLASAVLAAPSEGLADRVARRRLGGVRNGNLNKNLGPGAAHRPKPHGSGSDPHGSGSDPQGNGSGSNPHGSGSNSSSGAVQQSSNWAGAALIADSDSATYTSVTGTFNVPSPSAPEDGGDGQYSAAAWVGIDGNTCTSAILQTGVDFTTSDDGSTTYDAWYEWFPDDSYDFTGIQFSAGDSVTVTVNATSATSGTAVIENNTNGQKVSKSLTSTSPLCQTNAEWIVEDFDAGGSPVPLVDFGTVTFTGAQVITEQGDSVGPAGATIIDMETQGGGGATAEADSSSVTVTYDGE